jgi:hypothetical protein
MANATIAARTPAQYDTDAPRLALGRLEHVEGGALSSSEGGAL